MAKMDAKNKGVDDAILLDIRGFVSEGCAWNIFLVKDDCVSTPSVASSILKGITRNVVIDLLKGLKIQIQERDVSLSELFTADEVFGTGTASEISPIIEINGRKIGDGKAGPITNRVEKKFRELIDEIETSV